MAIILLENTELIAIYIQNQVSFSIRLGIGCFDQNLETLFVEMDGSQVDCKTDVILGPI